MIKRIAIATAAIVAMATGLAAEEYQKYGAEGPWTIWANKTSGGCFLEDRSNNGNTVQMGIRTNKDTLAFMGVWNHNQSLLEPGESRDMKLDVDGTVYTFTATANEAPVSNGMTGGYMYLNNPDFIADVEKGQTLTVHASDSLSLSIDLTGTQKGIAMARECFQAQNA